MTLFGVTLCLVALLAVGHAQENVASPPVEHGRTAFEQMLSRVPSSCVGELQDEAVQICSSDCMIAVPDLDLPDADSCDLRIWGCVWPEQQASLTASCPSGWTGSYNVQRTYEVRDCGINLVQVGSPVMGSGDCTRTRTETEVRSTCGSGYSGTQTFSRTISEQLNPLTSAITVVSTSAWTMTTNSCVSNSCTAPWGGSVAHGSSVAAYVMYDNGTCGSQTRTCSNGTLSGSYTLQSCTPTCTTPWGSTIVNGSSVTAYAASSGTSCTAQTRTCSMGTLSGTYQYGSCTVVTPACSFAPCLSTRHNGWHCPNWHNPYCPTHYAAYPTIAIPDYTTWVPYVFP